MITNGGFESGRLDPWAPYQAVQASVDMSRAFEGKFSLAESAAQGSVYQDVKGLVPGVGYTISARASWSTDANAAAQIAVFDPVANVATSSDILSPAPGWHPLSHKFKLIANSQGVARIHLFRNGGTGTVFWDDVRIVRSE
jgi:hypothetical protein